MALADLTSPTAIRLAIQECDRLGREQFLHHYGFAPAREYLLRYKSKTYDSKAIGCVAHAIENSALGVLRNVSGGKDAVGKRVFELGFDVDGLHRRADDWTLDECETTVNSYFDCLQKKLEGKTYNRASACRKVAGTIGRTVGAVDYKFQNIDAILFKHGLPRMMNAIAKNTQRLLEWVVLDPFAKRSAVFEVGPAAMPPIPAIADVFVAVPAFIDGPKDSGSAAKLSGSGVKIDFAARDARNRNLGYRGEQWVVWLEQLRLKELGLPDLAERVKWVASENGDGLGYDVLSFDETGQEKYIEVKTTNAGAETPFFVTPNELAFADAKGAACNLYRVFDFSSNPKVFVLEGPLTHKLRLQPSAYSAVLVQNAAL